MKNITSLKLLVFLFLAAPVYTAGAADLPDVQPLWHKVQELVGITNIPLPAIEVKDLADMEQEMRDQGGLGPHEELMGRFLEDHYRILIAVKAFTLDKQIHGYIEYVILHEFAHAALFKKDIPSIHHHCWMAQRNILPTVAEWVLTELYDISNPNPESYELLQKAVTLQIRHGIACINRDMRT